MIKAKLIAKTTPVEDIPAKDANEFIAYVARVSNPDNQANTLTAPRLIKYLAKHKHWSPFEHYYLTLEVEAPKDIAVQLLRHRSFTFQEFCVAGDTLITTETNSGRSKKVKIADLYKRYQSPQYWDMSDNLVRVFDEDDRILKPAKIKEVFKTGVKPVYRLTLDNGRQVKATAEHKFLTMGGFKRLKDISEADFIASNGVPVYQDYEWLKAAKEKSIVEKTGVAGIATAAGVSYHTIRKWLRMHGLSFTRAETAQYTDPWNKGLPPQYQPNFGRSHSEETRDKMREAADKGEANRLYRTGGNVNRSFRKKVADYWLKRKKALYAANGGKCYATGVAYDLADLEIDHIEPVSQRPDLAYDENNIRLIHKDAHAEKSRGEVARAKHTVTWQKVTAIEYVGEEETFDMEVEHVSHNYVANGIVTHNSQRYADVSQMGFTLRECRLQDAKNRQNSLTTNDGELVAWWVEAQADTVDLTKALYSEALEKGIAKEQARALLPIGLTMSRLYVTGNVRSFIHYLSVRQDPTTQKEHRQLADAIEAELNKIFDMSVLKPTPAQKLKPLNWSEDDAPGIVSRSPLYAYRIVEDEGKFATEYTPLNDIYGFKKTATGFLTVEDAKKWANDHHVEKMAPWLTE